MYEHPHEAPDFLEERYNDALRRPLMLEVNEDGSLTEPPEFYDDGHPRVQRAFAIERARER